MARTATCACGQASVTVGGEPTVHAVCHCTNCKRRTGSAFGWSAYYPRAQLLGLSGAMTRYACRSSVRDEDQERFFCSTCGSTLYWLLSTAPDLVGIAAGCFAEDPPGEPTLSSTHRNKEAWVGLPEGWRHRVG